MTATVNTVLDEWRLEDMKNLPGISHLHSCPRTSMAVFADFLPAPQVCKSFPWQKERFTSIRAVDIHVIRRRRGVGGQKTKEKCCWQKMESHCGFIPDMNAIINKF